MCTLCFWLQVAEYIVSGHTPVPPLDSGARLSEGQHDHQTMVSCESTFAFQNGVKYGKNVKICRHFGQETV